MTASQVEAYRAEVVGSLLRPDYLKEAAEQHAAGSIDDAALAQAQDRAVREAVRLQEECGVDVLTDGEMRRVSWTDPLTAGLAGFAPAQAPVNFVAAPGAVPQLTRLPACTDRLAPRANVLLREARYLQAHTRRPIKVTLPAPSHAGVLWVPGVSDTAYPDRATYLADVLRLMTAVVADVVASGVDYVQLDAPRYTHLASEAGHANFRRVGIDPLTWLDEMIALDNALIAAIPNVTWALHLCRGNARSQWAVEGGYDVFAEQLFAQIRCQRLFLEYDSARAGTFEPLRFVPTDKTVVLGLITTKEPELESADELRRRVFEASRHVPLDRLALSPQCGFASVLAGNRITEGDQRAKLERLVEVARDVWG